MTDNEQETMPSKPQLGVWTISVTSSIVASAVFLIFFQPILEFISRSMSAILGAVAIGLLDRIYQQASVGVVEPIVFFLLMFVMFLMWNIAAVPIVVFYSKMRKQKKVSNAIKNDSGIARVGAIVSAVGFALCSTYIVSSSYICIQASVSFNGYLNASRPYLSEQEEDVLISNWALMNSRSDYVNIMESIEGRSRMGGWDLPSRLI